MALFNFLKKKKPEKKKEEVKKEIKEKKKPLKKKEEIKVTVPKPKRKISDKAFKVLHSPHITEKATTLGEENKYLFKVLPRSNKIEIKKAIEDLYGVDVIDVKIINVPKRQRRMGRQMGWRKGYKKAIVKIEEGQKIEILPR